MCNFIAKGYLHYITNQRKNSVLKHVDSKIIEPDSFKIGGSHYYKTSLKTSDTDWDFKKYMKKLNKVMDINNLLWFLGDSPRKSSGVGQHPNFYFGAIRKLQTTCKYLEKTNLNIMVIRNIKLGVKLNYYGTEFDVVAGVENFDMDLLKNIELKDFHVTLLPTLMLNNLNNNPLLKDEFRKAICIFKIWQSIIIDRYPSIREQCGYDKRLWEKYRFNRELVPTDYGSFVLSSVGIKSYQIRKFMKSIQMKFPNDNYIDLFLKLLALIIKKDDKLLYDFNFKIYGTKTNNNVKFKSNRICERIKNCNKIKLACVRTLQLVKNLNNNIYVTLLLLSLENHR